MESLTVCPIDHLQSTLSMPGDKSLSHRAAIFAGLAKGRSVLRNFLPSEDCLNTLEAMRQLGAEVEILKESPSGPVELAITGVGGAPQAPTQPLDCGNSGTGMRLLSGVLSAFPFRSVLTGDESLQSRPMGRIITPLTEMGARLEAQGEKEGCAPLAIEGGQLQPLCYELPMASAQVKSAVLLAALFTPGRTEVIEPATTRDHTERLGAVFGLRFETEGARISVEGPQLPQAAEVQIPGDFSSAAFWMVAAAARPGWRVRLEGVGLNPTRTALLAVIQRMGAQVEITPAADLQKGEPMGDLSIEGRELQPVVLQPEEVANLIDEIPVLAVLATQAQGRSELLGAAELRVKETDRIATTAAALHAVGARVEERPDGLIVDGPTPLAGARVQSAGDHRIAMAMAMAGLFAEKGEMVIENTACIRTSYPSFFAHLDQILAPSA